eukprot:8661831-Alexandrium_andersonii.AAC.1
MSASLVGSEMCIRDSFDSEPFRRTAWLSCLPRSGTVSELVNGIGRSSCCLLYTSDAADDM